MALPHNIVNGPKPDADEVMANFNYLENKTPALQMVTKQGTGSAAQRKTVGTSTGTFPGTTQVLSIAKPSLLLLNYSAQAVMIERTGMADYSVRVMVDINGSEVGFAYLTDLWMGYYAGPNPVVASSGQIISRPIVGHLLIPLSPGSHTLKLTASLKLTNTITPADLNNSSVKDGAWSGFVIAQ